MTQYRIGIDLGGTKIEITVLAGDGTEQVRHRIPTPPGYEATLDGIAGLVGEVETKLGQTATVGIGIPGVISPATGRVKNANSIALNGHSFDRDISAKLDREVRVENDANCFALSEAVDGAGAGYSVVFGVILGTGVGGGIVVNGTVHRGPHRIAAEWGHNPLPWPSIDEIPAGIAGAAIGAAWRPTSPARRWRATATGRRRMMPAAFRPARRRAKRARNRRSTVTRTGWRAGWRLSSTRWTRT